MSALSTLAKQRRLNIVDDIVAYKPDHKHRAESMMHDARDAHRFILGDEASHQVGLWVAGCEDILLDNRQFARPPFPKTYVELTIREVHRGIKRPTSGPDETADDRVGFLINGNHVRTCVSGPGGKPYASFGAWEYWLDTPDDKRLLANGMRDEWARLVLLLGSTYDQIKDEDQRLAIAHSVRIRSTFPEIFGEERLWKDGKLITQYEEMIIGAAGEIRTLWAVLLLINQHRKHISFTDVPRQIAITARGRRVYLAHTLITLPIHQPQEARCIYYPDKRASPVGHEVRGHWVRYHLSQHCEHVWDNIPDDNGHFQCHRCKGWRTWRKPHHRGNSASGFNTHDYEVTP